MTAIVTALLLIKITDTTAMNPQFVIQIPRGVASKCHVVVAVVSIDFFVNEWDFIETHGLLR